MRTRYQFGALVLTVLLTAAPVSRALSDPATTPKGEPAQPAAETRPRSPSATSSESSAAGGAEVKPADPFVPSESISADSAISFPVDI
jgi:hypothetical protein